MTDLIWVEGGWQAGSWACDDRALHYGDGLFETIRLNAQGEAPLWALHRQRLQQGLTALHFPAGSLDTIDQAWQALPLATRQLGAGKLLVSRGSGPRGYAIPSAPELRLLWQSFTPPSWAYQRFPQGFVVDLGQIALSRQPLLAGFKHLNRLEQVLARQSMPDHCQELVLCDTSGQVVEGCMSNLVVCWQGHWLTPPLTQAGVNGVVRRWLLQEQLVSVADITPEILLTAESVFFCNTLNGIIAVHRLADRVFHHEDGQRHIDYLQQRLEALFC